MALPASHPALGDPGLPLQLADVAAEPLVIFPRAIAPSLYDAVLAAYRAHGATPLIGQEAIQMQTIVNLVSAGMGVAWVPASVTRLQRPVAGGADGSSSELSRDDHQHPPQSALPTINTGDVTVLSAMDGSVLEHNNTTGATYTFDATIAAGCSGADSVSGHS